MTKYFATLALFVSSIALQSTSLATQPQTNSQTTKSKSQSQTSSKTQRSQFIVKHLEASALASVVNKHFKGEAEVSALPAGAGNTLLISGSPESVSEVIKLLEQLDQKPKTIEVEIVIAEFTTKKGADSEELELSGLEPLAKLDALSKAGQIGNVQRIKLTVDEGQQITSTNGGSKPYVTSTVAGPGGFNPGGDVPGPRGGSGPGGGGPGVRRSVSYHEAGTTVKLSARICAEDKIALDLSVQDCKIRSADTGDEAGAAAFDNNSISTKLNVPAGKAVTAQSVRSDGKSTRSMSLLIVSARIVESGMSKSK